MKETAYLLQATLISLWWIGLSSNQVFFDAFQFPGIGKTGFNSFMLPDLLIIACLSIVRVYKNKTELDFIILGGFSFATLYCLNATILTNGGHLSTIIMVLGLFYNLFLINEKKIFRNSNTESVIINGAKTVLQIICVWTITLLVFPYLIITSFRTSFIPNNDFAGLGYGLLLFFSIIGLFSAITMVKVGKGTPLPLDQTQKLVTSGLYKHVRNPMAIAGIGQGIALSIILCSIHIIIYTLIGAILWQYVVRPLEERNMKERFGKEYDQYLKDVECWVPKIN